MEDSVTSACWACAGIIAPEDNYCRFCGKGQGKCVPWYYKHWGIITLTLLAMGPFSIVFVWKSPLLSRRAKWAYTVVIAALTWYIVSKIYGFWCMLSGMLNPVMYPGSILGI
ncbi:MAG: hypothetical protein NTX59_07185 [Elusimicrobia bacterium]|nr:hypothetical protein [Elusimicrobiota bacterium]